MLRYYSTHATILFLVGVFNLCGSHASAQHRSDENLHIQQVEVEATELSHEEAIETILQRLQDGEQRGLLSSYLLTGHKAGGSFAIINQDGESNAADVVQIGLSNLAVLHQQGNLNITLLEQLGDHNLFGAWLTGDGNYLDVRQEGNDNIYLLDFIGDNLNHSVVQQGDGIHATQIGSGSQPFSIEQTGSGMNIRIEHNGP